MTKTLVILCLTSFQVLSTFGSDIFEKISSKTWFEEDGFGGTTMIFVKSENGLIKAIRQKNGSGVPVLWTEVYDVEIEEDTIFLTKKSFLRLMSKREACYLDTVMSKDF